VIARFYSIGIGARLDVIMKDPNTTSKQVIPEIERLTVIVQHLMVPYDNRSNQQQQQRHPVIELMSSCWNLLDTATKRFPRNNSLAEKICRLHKHSLRMCGTVANLPLLDSLLINTVSYGRKLREEESNNNSNTSIEQHQQRKASLEYVISHEGEHIVTNVIRALIGDLPNTNQNALSELLYKMNFLCPQLLQQTWLMNGVFANNRSEAKVIPDNAKQGLIRALQNGGCPREDFNLVIREFIRLCGNERMAMRRNGVTN